MPGQTLKDLKLAEYRQRRRIESLRQQLYAHPDPEQEPELSAALVKAEQELKTLEQQRMEREKEKNAGRGVLLTTVAEDEKEPALKEPTTEAPRGILLGKDTTGIDVKVLLRMSHVPTGVAHLLDVKTTPLVSFEITNTKGDAVRLRMVSYVDGYSSQAVDTIELMPDKSTRVDQLPTFFPDRLARITEVSRATLNIQIDDLDGKVEQQSTFPIWMLARTSAFNSIYDPGKDEWIDLSYYYGAWVTPNAPEVMQLLRHAADKHPEKSMAGYQVDKAGVAAQVKAIYNALKEEKITYIHSVLSFGATEGQSMQRVRLPRESLATKAANCIDGTVLMASVLEAASLNPGFVFVPSHAFLAWETEEESGEWDFVETTMISTHTFEAARKEGRRQAVEQQAAFAKSKDIDDYQLLSLAELRALRGVTPME